MPYREAGSGCNAAGAADIAWPVINCRIIDIGNNYEASVQLITGLSLPFNGSKHTIDLRKEMVHSFPLLTDFPLPNVHSLNSINLISIDLIA